MAKPAKPGPVSPLVPAAFLAAGLTNTELDGRVKFSWSASVFMLPGVIFGLVPTFG